MVLSRLAIYKDIICHKVDSLQIVDAWNQAFLEGPTDTFQPNNNLGHLYLSNGVPHIVSGLESSSKAIRQNAECRSNFVKKWACAKSGRISFNAGELKHFLIRALFSGF